MNPHRKRRCRGRSKARRPARAFEVGRFERRPCGCVFSIASKTFVRGCVRLLVKYVRRCDPDCSARLFGAAVTLEEQDWTFEVTVEGVRPERVIDRRAQRLARSRAAAGRDSPFGRCALTP